jgi:hypothetical protein
MNPFVKDLVRLHHAEILDTFATKFERPKFTGVKESVQEAASYLFNKAEEFNRGVAYLAGLDQAKAMGLTGEDAIRHAREVVRITQFFAGRLDAPLFSRTPTGKVLMQFKTFTFKELEFIEQLPWKGKLKFLIATLLLGGPAALLIVQGLKTFFPHSDITKKAEELQESANLAALLHSQRIVDQFGIFTVPGLEDFGTANFANRMFAWAAGPTVNAMADTIMKSGIAVASMGPGEKPYRKRMKRPSSPTLRAMEAPFDLAVKGMRSVGVDRGPAEQWILGMIRDWAPGGAELLRAKKAMDEAKTPQEAVRILFNFVEEDKKKRHR